jgi:site-specific DNA-methyltransferase (adenine-specific)
MTILHGDCRHTLRTLAACSVDSIVTDPPYELGFMGKHWDASGIAYDIDMWRECLRVLKPGGHLLAFGGTRTYHRMAVAIEDAGFEVRDSIHWLYGSGFPKSLDVSKAIDKRGGYPHLAAQIGEALKEARIRRGVTAGEADQMFCNGTSNWSWFEGRPRGQRAPTPATFARIVAAWPELDALAEAVAEAEREVVGSKTSGIANKDEGPRHTIGASQAVEVDITAPATDAAKRWDGWGTALKPAHEPIVVARKPLVGTVAQNVLQHGTGALNIDGGRVGTSDVLGGAKAGWLKGGYVGGESPQWDSRGTTVEGGRWPANLVLTHAADCADTCAAGCPVAELDRQSGERPTGQVRPYERSSRPMFPVGQSMTYEKPSDTGGASRFFTVTEWDPITDVPFRYVAKPGKTERNAGLDGLPEVIAGSMSGGAETRPNKGDTRTPRQNHHPTVKPLDLMRWLVRLVTPPGGTVLDPFLGSGTTAVAAILEGFDWVGCELTADYLPIIEGRTAWARQHLGHKAPQRTPAPTVDQLDLFGGDAA